MGIVIGLDVGTTNWKVAAFREDGSPFCEHKCATRTHYMDNGCGYYDPKELWDCFAGLLRDVAEDCKNEEILGISVTSMAESVVPIGPDGDEIFPIIAWFDGSAKEQAERLTEAVGQEKIFSICGLDPDPIFSLPKIMWVRDHYPDVYDKAVVWLQMADFMYYKLTGVFATEYTLACRTLAFDLEKRDWSEEMLRTANVPASVFPQVLPSGTYVGGVTSRAHTITGIPEGVKVFTGGHDHPCATLTTGCMNGTKIMDSSGTAEAFLMMSALNAPIPHKPEGQRVGLYLDPDRYVLWGGIKASGASADWGYGHLTTNNDWEDDKSSVDYKKVLDAMEELPIGSDGLVYIPHLRGSGAPMWNPDDRGAFIGMKSIHDDKMMMHAIFEGLSCQARMIVEMHQRISGLQAEAVCVAGGSTKNLYWQQLKANLINKPIEISPFDDATVQGAAMLAAIGAGVYSSLEEVSKKVAANTVIMPHQDNREIYDKLYERYCKANEAVCKISREISSYSF